MKVVRSIDELRRARGEDIGFVPTMGALHEGHLSLMRQAREESQQVVASVFVNPTQFGQGEDFERYPRDEERDFALAKEAGVDLMFAPTVAEIYPRKTTTVRVSGVSERYEGEVRPGHFDGVATVVCKLFNIVQPARAYFGLKDLQQCAVIRRMVEDLNLPVELVFSPTVREPHGLAMSSRNAYLSPADRVGATAIYRELVRCALALRYVETESSTEQELATSVASLESGGLTVDYFALVDTQSFEPLNVPAEGASLIAAAHIGGTRLIDNVQLDMP